MFTKAPRADADAAGDPSGWGEADNEVNPTKREIYSHHRTGGIIIGRSLPGLFSMIDVGKLLLFPNSAWFL